MYPREPCYMQWIPGPTLRPNDASMRNLSILGSDNGLSAPSHYLNQCWHIVNWTLRNKLQWNLNRNSYILIQENTFENVVCEMASLLSRPQCVNTMRPRQNGRHFTDNLFKCIFMNEKVNWSLFLRLKLTIFHRWPGDKPLSEPMMVRLPRHICITWP